MSTCDPNFVENQFHHRNRTYEEFFERESLRLSVACQAMAERFLRGGRLIAFGRGVYATDAQQVSAEFMHPVIAEKRALPALDVSLLFEASVAAIVGPEDIVVGFGPPGGDPAVAQALDTARRCGAMTFALPGSGAEYDVQHFSDDPFQHQEMIEIVHHILWETVHVFLENSELGSEAREDLPENNDVVENVAASIRAKVNDDALLRDRAISEEAFAIMTGADVVSRCVQEGGKLILFGNGGSAGDASDWALDCVAPPTALRPIPAVSIASEPALLTAIADDEGTEAIFQRQLIHQGKPGDTVIAISTDGESRNVVAALEEARKRNLFTIALLGYDGGEVVRRGLADLPIVVRCEYVPRIQEVQASVYHVMRELVEQAWTPVPV